MYFVVHFAKENEYDVMKDWCLIYEGEREPMVGQTVEAAYKVKGGRTSLYEAEIIYKTESKSDTEEFLTKTITTDNDDNEEFGRGERGSKKRRSHSEEQEVGEPADKVKRPDEKIAKKKEASSKDLKEKELAELAKDLNSNGVCEETSDDRVEDRLHAEICRLKRRISALEEDNTLAIDLRGWLDQAQNIATLLTPTSFPSPSIDQHIPSDLPSLSIRPKSSLSSAPYCPSPTPSLELFPSTTQTTLPLATDTDANQLSTPSGTFPMELTNMDGLLHQGPGADVEELVPGAGVFIAKSALLAVKCSAKTHSGIARALMTAVFTKESLTQCSLTGKASNARDKLEPVRASLNSKGVHAIFELICNERTAEHPVITEPSVVKACKKGKSHKPLSAWKKKRRLCEGLKRYMEEKRNIKTRKEDVLEPEVELDEVYKTPSPLVPPSSVTCAKPSHTASLVPYSDSEDSADDTVQASTTDCLSRTGNIPWSTLKCTEDWDTPSKTEDEHIQHFIDNDPSLIDPLITHPSDYLPSDSKLSVKNSAEAPTLKLDCEPESLKVTVSKHNNIGKQRVYDKRDACLYCGKLCTKVIQHLKGMHSDEIEVTRILALKKNSKERMMNLQTMRKKGNFLHNKKVLTNKTGELLLKRRPSAMTDFTNFLPCDICLGFYKKSNLAQHYRKCLKINKTIENKHVRVQAVAKAYTLMAAESGDISNDVKVILEGMRSDKITSVVCNDDLIKRYGTTLCEKYKDQVHLKNDISQKMRELARLLITIQEEGYNISNLREALDPCNFQAVMSTVKKLCSLDSTESKKPTLALKIGYSLQKCLGIIRSESIMEGDSIKKAKAEGFQSLYDIHWTNSVSRRALNLMDKARLNKPSLIPLARDGK